jgi:hypothetical protein
MFHFISTKLKVWINSTDSDIELFIEMCILTSPGLHILLAEEICFSRIICFLSTVMRCLSPSVFVLAAGGNIRGSKYTNTYIWTYTQTTEQVCLHFVRERTESNPIRVFAHPDIFIGFHYSLQSITRIVSGSFPLVSHSYETWSLNLEEENKLQFS